MPTIRTQLHHEIIQRHCQCAKKHGTTVTNGLHIPELETTYGGTYNACPAVFRKDTRGNLMVAYIGRDSIVFADCDAITPIKTFQRFLNDLATLPAV